MQESCSVILLTGGDRIQVRKKYAMSYPSPYVLPERYALGSSTDLEAAPTERYY